MASGSLEATAPSDDTSAADELVRQAREEERRLVQSAIVHDAAAFAALYDLHVVRVYRHIYYLVHDVKQTEDLTAQTFLKAWEAVARYKERGAPFIAWLLRIAHNLTVSYLRAKKDPGTLEDTFVVALWAHDSQRWKPPGRKGNYRPRGLWRTWALNAKNLAKQPGPRSPEDHLEESS